ncbi:hypothetical protein NE281_05450, partial [Leuconostoc mesenteroides]
QKKRPQMWTHGLSPEHSIDTVNRYADFPRNYRGGWFIKIVRLPNERAYLLSPEFPTENKSCKEKADDVAMRISEEFI